MNKIQLLYAANEISKERGLLQQELSFIVLADNLAFAKQIDIVWAGEDGIWHTLPARFHSTAEHNKEYWNATAKFHATPSLPGKIQFAVRYQTSGVTYWDNNLNLNYHCQTHSCLQQSDDRALLNIGFNKHLNDEQKLVPITVAVNQPVHARKVSVLWTTDNWKHINKTRCHLKSSLTLERDGQSIQGGVQIWKALLNIGQDFRLQYSICCESDDQVLWDNNAAHNFSASRKPLNVLVLNLHCYQEEDQDFKFSQIANAIKELNVDIICLQEVAENWNDMHGDWASNSVKIINDRLESNYHIHTDWAHLGFDRYREGVAILSKYPISKYDARYLSHSTDPYSIHTRKAVMAQIDIPCIGKINFFSSHISWWDDGFSEQFKNLRDWADSLHYGRVYATLLCGDFNIKAGSRGYEKVVNSNDYEDQFLAANHPDVFEKIFRNRQENWQRLLDDDHRIDYIFKKKSSGLRVTSARTIFTDLEYGRVSDHEGYLMTFEPK
jgi:maltose 6'-phosphate phosphatase